MARGWRGRKGTGTGGVRALGAGRALSAGWDGRGSGLRVLENELGRVHGAQREFQEGAIHRQHLRGSKRELGAWPVVTLTKTVVSGPGSVGGGWFKLVKG